MPLSDRFLLVAAILAVGWMVAVAVALHYRADAIHWRRRAAHWRGQVNAARGVVRSVRGRRCSPSRDGEVAGRIAAYLTGRDLSCR